PSRAPAPTDERAVRSTGYRSPGPIAAPCPLRKVPRRCPTIRLTCDSRRNHVRQLADLLTPARYHRLTLAHVLGNDGVAVAADVQVLVGESAFRIRRPACYVLGLGVVPMQAQVSRHHLLRGLEDRFIDRVILVSVKCHLVLPYPWSWIYLWTYSLIPAFSAAARPISYIRYSFERSRRSGIPHLSSRSKCSCICLRLNWVVMRIPCSMFSFLSPPPARMINASVSSVAAAPANEMFSASSRCACSTSRFSGKCSSTYLKCCMP